MTKELLAPDALKANADAIKREDAEFRKEGSSMLARAIRIGECLHATKAGMKHGDFQNWVIENAGLSLSSASSYMLMSKKKRDGELPDDVLCSGSMRKALATSGDEKKKPSKKKAAKKKKKAVHIDVLDPARNLGKSPEETIVDGKEMFKVILDGMQYTRRQIKRLAELRHGGAISITQVDTAMVNAFNALRAATPWNICVYCFAKSGPDKKCRPCRGTGWMPKVLYTQAPDALKKLAKGGAN